MVLMVDWIVTYNIYQMKGFGFPGKAAGSGGGNQPTYRADTSKQKV